MNAAFLEHSACPENPKAVFPSAGPDDAVQRCRWLLYNASRLPAAGAGRQVRASRSPVGVKGTTEQNAFSMGTAMLMKHPLSIMNSGS
jgi:hypothetical protein